MMAAFPQREALLLPAGQVRGDGEAIELIDVELHGTSREHSVRLGPVTLGEAVAGSTHGTSVVDTARAVCSAWPLDVTIVSRGSPGPAR